MMRRLSCAAPAETLTFYDVTAAVLSNITNSVMEVTGGAALRTRFDLSSYSLCRQQASIITPGVAGCTLIIQYSVDGVTWRDLTLPVSVNPLGRKYTAWSAIPADARGDVELRLVGQGGDGATDFAMSAWYLEVK